MRSHLSHALHIFTTCVCLMANLMPSNLMLFLTVHLCAVHGYAATHMHITYFILLFHSATTMQLPYVSPISIYLSQNSIDRFSTNMYTQYDSIKRAKESTGIPSLIFLEFHFQSRLVKLPSLVHGPCYLFG